MRTKKISVLLCAFLATGSFSLLAQSGKLISTWTTDTTLTTPESVLYDAKTNTVYVSCINGSPTPTNNGSFIAKIGLDGKIVQRMFVQGLNSTKGMGMANGKLYVAEIFKLVEIDPKSGKVLNKYDVPDAKFLNDISTDGKIVYFTDMRSNRLWMLQNGKIEKVAEGTPLTNPNGVLYENGKLLVGNGDGKILSLDLKTKQFSTFAEGMGGIDGLVPDGKKGYFASEWKGKVWHVSPDGKAELLLDSVDAKVNTADIEYIPGKNMLLVPTFLNNKVMAYKYQ